MHDIITTDGRLKPASGREITEQLNRLFEALPRQAGAAPQVAMEGYLIALQGRPLWAIESAIRRFLRAEVRGASTKFCPRPPELAEAVTAELAHVYEEMELKRIKAASEARVRQQITERREEFSEEHRTRMKFNFAVLSMGMSRHNPEAVKDAWDRGQAAMVELGVAWGIPVPDSLQQKSTA